MNNNMNFYQPPGFEEEEKSQTSSTGTNLAQGLASVAFGSVIESTKQQAKSFTSGWTFDRLKPYFDVEPKDVIKRLIFSMLPRRSSELMEKPELYGPLVLLFTLVLTLHTGMKLQVLHIDEGTLLGSAFAVCFTFWIMFSLLLNLFAYFFESNTTFLGIFSVTGYALFPLCVDMLLLFIVGWFLPIYPFSLIILGGSSSITLATIFYSLTPNPQRASIFGAVSFFINFLFVLYLETYAHSY